jgi:hypothetical protein
MNICDQIKKRYSYLNTFLNNTYLKIREKSRLIKEAQEGRTIQTFQLFAREQINSLYLSNDKFELNFNILECVLW